MGALLDPFRDPITQRALAEVTILGLACGPLGVWIVLYRSAYAAESFSHAMLPGLVVAALAGAPLLLGAAGGVLLGAVAVAAAARDRRIGADTAVAVVITTLVGGGALLALSPDVPARLDALLFGDLLATTGGDLAVAAALCGLVLLGLRAGHRPLALAGFDAAAARALGVRPGRVQLGLLVALAVTLVAAVPALGNLLVVALLIAPGAAALRLATRLGRVLALAAAFSVLAGVLGLEASYHLDVAAGAAVALAAVGIYAVAALIRRGPRRPARTLRPAPVEALSGSR